MHESYARQKSHLTLFFTIELNITQVWSEFMEAASVRFIKKQACAAEIAVLYASLACKQNKRYRTSARLTKTRDRCSNVNKHGTDGRTDGHTDRQSATQYAAPS